MLSSRRDLTRLIILTVIIMADVLSKIAAIEPTRNMVSSAAVARITDEPDQRMLTVEQKQQQLLFDPLSPSSSLLPSSLSIPISFDQHDDYYIRYSDGQVKLRRAVDEKILIDLMNSFRVSPLRPNYEDRKPVLELLVDLFYRRHRRPGVIAHDAPVLKDSVLTNEQTPSEQVDETDLLLFLADVFDRTLYMNERRANGELVSASEVGYEIRLGQVVAELQAAVNAMDAIPERDPIRQMFINADEDNLTLPLWKQFENKINQYELYSKEDEPMVDEVMNLLMEVPVINIEEMWMSGTNLKLFITNEDESTGLFKPKRHDRFYELPLEVSHYRDAERHLAEIAAYHLDRTLGFRRVPPVIGVQVALTETMRELMTPEFQATFYESPGGNVCFYGTCMERCNTHNAVCGQGALIEGSLAYFLPNTGKADWVKFTSPWKRSYTHQIPLADWKITEKADGYCDKVRQSPPFNSERALVNLVDLHIFDFIQGNLDRHHINMYRTFGNDSFIIAFDNGRGFGRANHDELTILAPLYQCCSVRLSTVRTLLDLGLQTSSSSSSGGGRLSDRMRQSLSKDPLSPVISDAHLEALDRRVGIVLDQIHQCLQRSDASDQVIFNY